MIGGQQPLRGRKLGDRRIRVERPHAAYFRWSGKGVMTARAAASTPTTGVGRAMASVRRVFLGRPLASEEELGERLSKKKALAIFSSDAISSSAYATEEILRVLILGGAAALTLGLEVSIAIVVLLVAVAISYRQVCIAYPTGGGSYSVSKRNFGRNASLIAASALLIDYVMTVAVSTTSAVEQITSALPELIDERVIIGVVAITLITIGNLRGLREAGNIFAIPTYLFLGSALLMIGIGAFRIVIGGEHSDFSSTIGEQAGKIPEQVGILLLLRAFAAGAVALTGTEAIATGVPAFQPPEAKNAASTLGAMAIVLGVLFIGITFLAVELRHHAPGPAGEADRHQPGRAARLRRRVASVLPVPGLHGPAPVPGREHELQRLPAPAGDPGHDWLHAAPVRVARRPSGLLVRDHRCWASWHRP